jgi:hypothetical protein
MIACCCRSFGTVFGVHAHVVLERFQYVEVCGVIFHERLVEILTCLQELSLLLMSSMCGHVELVECASFSSEVKAVM